MADGGWIYHNLSIPSTDTSIDAQVESNIIDPLIVMLSGISGWSVDTAKTKHNSYGSWYFIMEHTSTAKLAVVVNGYLGSTFDYGIDISNAGYDNGYSISPYRGHIFLAYWPPGNSGPQSANPEVADYIPDDGFLFLRGTSGANGLHNTASTIHVMARDDDLLWVSDQGTTVMAQAMFMGTIMEPYYSADNGTLSTEASIFVESDLQTGGNWFSSSDVRIDAPPVQSGYPTGTRVDNYSWLTSTLNGSAPWHYVPFICANPFDNINPPVYRGEVVENSGFKGRLSLEAVRLTVASGGPSEKQQLVSGNYIHVKNGFVLGYDPSNGAMS